VARPNGRRKIPGGKRTGQGEQLSFTALFGLAAAHAGAGVGEPGCLHGQIANLKSAAIASPGAENGFEVLARLEQQRFDLILMDVQMPDMGGQNHSPDSRAETDIR